MTPPSDIACPACQTPNRTGRRFCGACGASLGPTCPSCHAPNDPGESTCGDCGASLAAEGPAPAAPASTPDPARPPHVTGSIHPPPSFAGGRYEIETLVGEGARKRVYRAYDSRLDRDVAIAWIKTEGLDASMRTRVRREARAMGRLGDHPNIVTVHDVIEESGEIFMVLQYMDDGLERLLRDVDEGRLDLSTMLRIARELCAALDYAHERQVVHRDLKPGNVWMDADGVTKLGDFGLALALDRTRLTAEGTMVGTAAYMAPEQALGGETDARSDLYALGVMLYEMATGRPPFLGDDVVAIVSQHVHTRPVAPTWHRPDLPEPLERLILALLDKDPDQRPSSAAAVRESLDAIASPTPETSAGRSSASRSSDSLERLARGVFVGREAELERVRRALDTALAGRGRIVLIAGEPGIGKTTTASELATHARLRNARVHWGRCHEGEGAPAYWPWRQVIRALVAEHDPDGLRSLLGSGAVEIAGVVSEVAEMLPELAARTRTEGDEGRFQLFDAVARFLRSASEHQPLVVVLDDLHWADSSSLLLLQFLVREIEVSRVFLLGTYRDVGLRRDHPLSVALGNLARNPICEQIDLKGFSREDVARYVELVASAQAADSLVAAIHRETEGNPFFVQEVVNLLQAEGGIREPSLEGRGRSLSIPQGVRQAIGRRLDGLPEQTLEVLTIAAVAGREFDLWLLASVCDVPVDEILERLEPALVARIVEEPTEVAERHRFTHALIRETIYDELSSARRMRLHRRIADAYEARARGRFDAYLSELAHHYLQSAALGDVEKAVRYAHRAAQRAQSLYAYAEAAAHYGAALEIFDLLETPNEDLRFELVLGLGRAQHDAAGYADESVESLQRAAELARALGSAEKIARTALANRREPLLFGNAGVVDHDQIALMEEALAGLGEDEPALRVRLQSRLVQEMIWAEQPERTDELSRAALATAEALGDPATLAEAWVGRYYALQGPEFAEERLRIAGQIKSYGESAGDAVLQLSGSYRTRVELSLLGRVDEERSERERFRALVVKVRLPSARLIQAYDAVADEVLAGRFDLAEEKIKIPTAIGEEARLAYVSQATAAQLVSIRYLQGRIQEAAPLVAAFADQNPNIAAWRAAAAIGLVLAGRWDEALAQLEMVAPEKFDALPRDPIWMGGLCLMADACLRIGEEKRLHDLRQLLLAHRDYHPWIFQLICFGHPTYFLGMIAERFGEVAEAIAYFEQAEQVCRRAGNLPWVVRARHGRARVLAPRASSAEDRRAVLSLVSSTLDEAQRIGMAPDVEGLLALRMDLQGVDTGATGSSILAVLDEVARDKPDLSADAAPDGTVTLLFSDIEGFSAMTEKLGDRVAHKVIAEHHAIVRAQVANHGGREVELKGDGFLLAFSSARRAVRCAIATQRAFAAYNQGRRAHPISVRMGIHTGEVIREVDGFFGKTVIQAARIADLASGGEILVSSLLREMLEGTAGIRFGGDREVELKGLRGTHGVVAVAWR